MDDLCLAGQDDLDLIRLRVVEQEVLDLIDEPTPGEVSLADLGLGAKAGPSEDR
jgi:hypothetical protein